MYVKLIDWEEVLEEKEGPETGKFENWRLYPKNLPEHFQKITTTLFEVGECNSINQKLKPWRKYSRLTSRSTFHFLANQTKPNVTKV